MVGEVSMRPEVASSPQALALVPVGQAEHQVDEGVVEIVREDFPARIWHEEELTVLVVWKLDRLGRSLQHLLEVVSGLRNRHVDFRSLTEALDTSTPGGRVNSSVASAIICHSKTWTYQSA